MQLSDRKVQIAAILIVAVGLAACGIAVFSEQLGLGTEEARGMFGWKRISLLVAGVLVVGTGALLLAWPQLASRIADRIRAALHLRQAWDRYPHSIAVALLVLLGLVLVWTRLMHITESLWHDEASAIFSHNSSPSAAFGGHVLYHQLTWATTNILGTSEAVHRLWSVVPGVAAVGFATWWAWRRIGIVAAVAFAALAVAAPLHLDIVPQARGYGLTLLAATLMLIAADRLTRAYSRWTLLGFLAAGLVGIWTLIFFAAGFLGQVVSLLRWPRLRPMAAAVLVAAIVLSLAFHRPVGYGQVQGELISLTGAVLMERTLEWLIVPIATLLGTDPTATLIDNPATPDWLYLVPLVLIVIALVGLWRRGDGGLALLLFVPPLVFNLVFSIGDINTVARHQLVLLPNIGILVAVGISEIGRLVARQPVVKPLAIAAGVVGVVLLSKAVLDEGHARALPAENFKEAGRLVHGLGISTVITDSSRPTGLLYYIGQENLDVLPAEEVEEMLCEAGDELVYIRHVPWPGEPTASLDCLTGTDAARVRVLQRSRGGMIDIWIVEPETDRATIEDDVPYAP